ncbi:MAG TPA: DUF6069 family protein [Galbitalea sp.]|jgi:hypothetical protein|nr:DUF6069 family protein [Galbitalea sp.]
MRSKSELSFRPARAIPLAMLIAAVATSAVNYLISVIGIALGTPASQLQLTPPVFIGVSVVVSVVGAAFWQLIARAAKDPARTLRWLVPVVFVLSFLPDLGLALLTSPEPSALLTLAVMHVATIAIATAVYSLGLPVRPVATQRSAAA